MRDCLPAGLAQRLVTLVGLHADIFFENGEEVWKKESSILRNQAKGIQRK